MTTTSLTLEERLAAHPQLRERREAVLGIVEDTSVEIEQAEEAERRVIDELRRLGNEALRSWAVQQERVQRTAVSQQGAVRDGEKNSTGRPRLGT